MLAQRWQSWLNARLFLVEGPVNIRRAGLYWLGLLLASDRLEIGAPLERYHLVKGSNVEGVLTYRAESRA